MGRLPRVLRCDPEDAVMSAPTRQCVCGRWLLVTAECATCAPRIAKAMRTRRSRPKPRRASRAEQRARYIDCGPQAWDDRD